MLKSKRTCPASGLVASQVSNSLLKYWWFLGHMLEDRVRAVWIGDLMMGEVVTGQRKGGEALTRVE